MPVAGLVLTLAEDEPRRSAILAALGTDTRIMVGEPQRGGRVPVVTETETLGEQQLLWNALADISGVLLVDLAFHDFSDIGSVHSSEFPSKSARRSA